MHPTARISETGIETAVMPESPCIWPPFDLHTLMPALNQLDAPEIVEVQNAFNLGVGIDYY